MKAQNSRYGLEKREYGLKNVSCYDALKTLLKKSTLTGLLPFTFLCGLLLTFLVIFSGFSSANAYSSTSNMVSKSRLSLNTNTGKNTANNPVEIPEDESSCLPCHGGKKFANNPKWSHLYISKKQINKSLHKDLKCLDCHTDLLEFARVATTTSKELLLDDPRLSKSILLVSDLGFSHANRGYKVYMAANLSCKNCKEHKKIGQNYDASDHGFKAAALSDNDAVQKKVPLCGDCHDSHYGNDKIEAMRNTFRSNAKNMCGKCHQRYFENYDDPYHGKPFKIGSKESPSCWDCHSAHNIKDKNNPGSSISKTNIKKTCGKCHTGCDDIFISYKPLIHNRQQIMAENEIVKLKNIVFGWLQKSIIDKMVVAYVEPLQSFLDGKYREYIRYRDKTVEIPTRSD